jgi:hypothetical protein
MENKRDQLIHRLYIIADALRVGEDSESLPAYQLGAVMEMAAEDLTRAADELLEEEDAEEETPGAAATTPGDRG